MRCPTEQDLLDARNAHLRRSLQDHAERVARRRATDCQPAQTTTVGDRMQALRSRVAARLRARQCDEDRVTGWAAADQVGGGAESSGHRHASCSAHDSVVNLNVVRTSKEDAKIHLLGPARGIQYATAERLGQSEEGNDGREIEAAAGAADRQEDGLQAEGAPQGTAVAASADTAPTSGAVVAAAHQVAWHTTLRQRDPAP